MGQGRVVVLASGSGSNLQRFLDEADVWRVERVVVDRHGTGAVQRAERAGVPAAVVAFADHADRAGWDEALADEVLAGRPDLVVLAGFMRIVRGRLLHAAPLLNVHPSLLPAFPGGHAVRDALAWGVKVTGCTVHLVDEQVDHGPIVAQEAVVVEDDDTEESLHERIKRVEHHLLPESAGRLLRGELQIEGRRVRRREPGKP